MLKNAEQNAVFLLTSPYEKSEVWAKIPDKVKKQIVDKKLKFLSV